TAEADGGLDPHDTVGEVGQDRGQGRVAREVGRVPAGRNRRPAAVVRGYSGADRPPGPGPGVGLRSAAPETSRPERPVEHIPTRLYGPTEVPRWATCSASRAAAVP